MKITLFFTFYFLVTINCVSQNLENWDLENINLNFVEQLETSKKSKKVNLPSDFQVVFYSNPELKNYIFLKPLMYKTKDDIFEKTILYNFTERDSLLKVIIYSYSIKGKPNKNWPSKYQNKWEMLKQKLVEKLGNPNYIDLESSDESNVGELSEDRMIYIAAGGEGNWDQLKWEKGKTKANLVMITHESGDVDLSLEISTE